MNVLLTVIEEEKSLEDRRLTIKFVDNLATVHKGIAKAKAELLKKPENQHLINYRLHGVMNHSDSSITFRIEPYVKDINRLAF